MNLRPLLGRDHISIQSTLNLAEAFARNFKRDRLGTIAIAHAWLVVRTAGSIIDKLEIILASPEMLENSDPRLDSILTYHVRLTMLKDTYGRHVRLNWRRLGLNR